MEFLALRCAECRQFCVQQSTKNHKWACRMCGKKQSIVKVFGRAPLAAPVRAIVQRLSLANGFVEAADPPAATAPPDRGGGDHDAPGGAAWAEYTELAAPPAPRGDGEADFTSVPEGAFARTAGSKRLRQQDFDGQAGPGALGTGGRGASVTPAPASGRAIPSKGRLGGGLGESRSAPPPPTTAPLQGRPGTFSGTAALAPPPSNQVPRALPSLPVPHEPAGADLADAVWVHSLAEPASAVPADPGGGRAAAGGPAVPAAGPSIWDEFV